MNEDIKKVVKKRIQHRQMIAVYKIEVDCPISFIIDEFLIRKTHGWRI